MYPGEFNALFRKIVNLFTLETIAEHKKLEGNYPKRSPTEPLWDCVDSLHHDEWIDIGEGKYVSSRYFFKKPMRILFFMLISEFETRLFRIHERIGKPIEELNEKTMKDFIVELLDGNLFKLQEEYDSERKLKEDLKAIGVFRNMIMHYNKKLEKTVEPDTIVRRKKQILKLLDALQQISDHLENH